MAAPGGAGIGPISGPGSGNDAPMFGRALLPHWTLEEGMIFLNHGSFGATPRLVQAEAARWQSRMESQPVRFFRDELPPALRAAATALAGFVGTAPERLAFVENATSGINAVLRSMRWQPGDEIVTTSHVYNAVRQTFAFLTTSAGVTSVEVPLGMPLSDATDVTHAIAARITPRTRLIVIDHIASATAVILPVSEIVALARAAGVPVLIDGAHAPGMVDLAIDGLGADYYVGNCHKWLCSPKGAAFLAVAPNAAVAPHPSVISHGFGQGFSAEFDWIGTRDCSPWLATPAAIDLHHAIGGQALRQRSTDLARTMAAMLADALGTQTGAPTGLFGAIATIRLPFSGHGDWVMAHALRDWIWKNRRMELLVTAFDGQFWIRISAAPYNEAADYEAIPAALHDAWRALT